MATIEVEKQARKKLENSLSKLFKIQPESLVRREGLGSELNFEDGLSIFKLTLDLFRNLENLNLTGFPITLINKLQNQTDTVRAQFKDIKEFSYEKYPTDALGQRNKMIDQIRNSYNSMYDSSEKSISRKTA